MNQSIIIKKLNGDGLLENKSAALDLGFGKGKDALSLSELGLKVDAVSINPNEITELEKVASNKKIKVVLSDIVNFQINNESYDCIIASNSLPFISSKEKVKEVVINIISGLKKGGCMYVTFFGTKDAWSNKDNMSFFEFDEIKNFIETFDVKFYHSTKEEGFGQTMKGEIKYWEIFKFIYIKN